MKVPHFPTALVSPLSAKPPPLGKMTSVFCTHCGSICLPSITRENFSSPGSHVQVRLNLSVKFPESSETRDTQVRLLIEVLILKDHGSPFQFPTASVWWGFRLPHPHPGQQEALGISIARPSHLLCRQAESLVPYAQLMSCSRVTDTGNIRSLQGKISKPHV